MQVSVYALTSSNRDKDPNLQETFYSMEQYEYTKKDFHYRCRRPERKDWIRTPTIHR